MCRKPFSEPTRTVLQTLSAFAKGVLYYGKLRGKMRNRAKILRTICPTDNDYFDIISSDNNVAFEVYNKKQNG